MVDTSVDKSLMKCFIRESKHAYKKSGLLVAKGVAILLICAVILALSVGLWYVGGSTVTGLGLWFWDSACWVLARIIDGGAAIWGFFAGISLWVYTILFVIVTPALYAAIKCVIKNYPSQVNNVLFAEFVGGVILVIAGFFNMLLFGTPWVFILGIIMAGTSVIIHMLFDSMLPKSMESSSHYSGDD